jgi:hypothetical protein
LGDGGGEFDSLVVNGYAADGHFVGANDTCCSGAVAITDFELGAFGELEVGGLCGVECTVLGDGPGRKLSAEYPTDDMLVHT